MWDSGIVGSCGIVFYSSKFSREPPGLPLSDFWEPTGGFQGAPDTPGTGFGEAPR